MIRSLADRAGYPADFPGAAAVLPAAESPARLLIADLFAGFTFVYDALDLTAGPTTVIPSPRGLETTSGVAYNPDDGRLYWAIGDRLVVTGVPGPDDMSFPPILVEDDEGTPRPLEFPVDLAGLAERVLGDASLAGTLGGLTYHAGRKRLWAVDIANDIYFEIQTDGSLSLDGDGQPIFFFSPERHPSGGGAFGNSITYAVAEGEEFFDVLTGSLLEGRPVWVHRVHAPSDPEAAGVRIGDDTGVRYRVVPGLVPATMAESAFPTAIAFWNDSCAPGQASEFLAAVDLAGGPPAILEVSGDPPTIGNVAALRCEPGENNSVELSWRSTGRYDTIEIRRVSLTDPSQEEVTILRHRLSEGPDPEGFLDLSLPIPPDGTYLYRAIASRSGGGFELAPEVQCAVTVGRGRLDRAVRFPADSSRRTRFAPVPYGIALTADEILVTDIETGIARRFLQGSLEASGEIRGPFAGQGLTPGIAYDAAGGRLYWLGRIGTTHYIQSTALDGSDLGPRRRVDPPPSLLRSPVLGDIAYEAGRNRIWTADALHGVAFAMTQEGAFVAGTLLESPAGEGTFAGGIAVVSADETNIVLDLTIRSQAEGPVDLLLRRSYPLADMANPTELFRLELARTTGSAAIAGIETRAGADSPGFEYLVGSDTALVHRLDLSPAPLTGLPFRRGDANNDGALNISDPSALLTRLFKGGGPLPCEDAADANDSGALDITDAVVLFDYLFRGGDPLPPPFEDCAFDATPSDLECEESRCTEELGP